MSFTSYSFKDNIVIDNSKWIRWLNSTGSTRYNILGTINENIYLNSLSKNIYINNSSNSYTFLNSNNDNAVIIGSKLGIGMNTTENINANLTLSNNSFIGLNTNNGYIGISSSYNLDSINGSYIQLYGNQSANNGSISLYAGNNNNGNINFYTGNNSLKFQVYNSGLINFTPDGSTVSMAVSDALTTVTTPLKVTNSNETYDSSSGSLQIAGGLSIAKNLYVGGQLITGGVSYDNVSYGNLATDSLVVGIGKSISSTFTAGNNISSPTNLIGLVFDNSYIRSFNGSASVELNRSVGGTLYETIYFESIYTETNGWTLYTSSIGDITGIQLSISNIGQIKYTSTNQVNWTTTNLRFYITMLSNTNNYEGLNLTSGIFAANTLILTDSSNAILNVQNGSFYSPGGGTFSKDLVINGNINFVGNLYNNGNLFNGYLWNTLNNSDIFYTSGNVGINTTNPNVNLQVNGNAIITNITNSNSFISNLNTTNVTSSNSNIVNLNTTNITSSNSIITNLNTTNITTSTINVTTGITAGSIYGNNVIMTTGNFSNSITTGALNTINLNTTNTTSSNSIITDLNTTNITTSTINVTTGITAGSIYGSNVIMTTGNFSNSITAGALNTINLNTTNITSSNSIITNLNTTNFTTSTLNVTTGITTGSIYGNNVIMTTGNFSNSITTGALNTINLNTTNITSSNSIITNLNTTNITTSTLNVTTGITTGSIYGNNAIMTTGNFINSITTGALNTINLNTTNITTSVLQTTNDISTNITTSTLNVTTGITTGSIYGNIAIMTTGNFINSITTGALNTINLNTTNITTSVLQTTNDISTNITTSTLNVSTGITTGSIYGNNAVFTNGNFINYLNASFNSNTIGSLITTNGNVGIGSSSPGFKLDVYGDINFSGNLYKNGILFSGGGGGGGENVWSIDNNNNIFYTSGNVGIGTTSPTYKLVVDGDVYATGDVIAFSDERLKTNISTISDALNKVEYMRGVNYTMKNTGKRNIGVIAQEIKEILPEVIAEKEEYLGVSYGNIVGVLIEAIKELSQKVKELENKLK
jgi:hypothetical protein